MRSTFKLASAALLTLAACSDNDRSKSLPLCGDVWVDGVQVPLPEENDESCAGADGSIRLLGTVEYSCDDGDTLFVNDFGWWNADRVLSTSFSISDEEYTEQIADACGDNAGSPGPLFTEIRPGSPDDSVDIGEADSVDVDDQVEASTTETPVETPVVTPAASPEATSITPAPETSSSRDNPVPLGQTADVGGGWSLTINDVNPDADADIAAGTEFNEPPADGNTYVVANITATYNGEGSDTSGIFVEAVGQSDVAIDPGAEGNAVPNEPYDIFNEVFSGGSVTGNVVFEVPTSDIDSLVLIGQALTSFDDRAFFATR